MKKTDPRVVLAIVASVLVLLVWAALTVALMASTLSAEARAQVSDLLAPSAALVVLTLLPVVGLLVAAWQHLFKRYVAPVAQLAEAVRVVATTDVQRPLPAQGSPELVSLAGCVQELAEQRQALQADIGAQVAEASARIEQERNRLAALMSELTQSVVVCNLDGRILLYNNRARMQFKALSAAPALSDGAELIGIGRSIYAAFDKQLVAHALESIEQRMKKGAAHPSAQFVTTSRAGQLLRVQMAPVRGLANSEGQESLGGFVLMLENITRAFQEESALDSMIHTLTERSRASLANMRAAIEMLEFPDLDAPMRERFQHVIRDEVNAMGERISHLVQTTSADIKTRWPLEDMLGADLLDAAQRRIQPLIKVPIAAADIVSNVWLKLDSFSILQMLSYLTERLADEFEVKYVQFRLGERDGRGQLDLVWSGQTMSTETVMTWEMDPMRVGTEATPLTVRDVVARHGGEMWFERDRVRHQAFFRFLLPLAEAREVAEAQRLMPTDSRPEYYDF
ncbi:MAG: DNA polymerase III subunit epsilon, partial [Burkholderiaceae bacterium]|nr:DNA polymerase III subunit epsilon [Burkholderiaceae bacterium]